MISRRSFLTGAAGAAGLVVVSGSLAACGKKSTGTTSAGASGGAQKTITLGFSQVGSESGWRSANTTSVKDAATAAGINLKFSDAEQKQENQIQAIRDYISQKVDVISFSPVVSSGWDTVLKEAKAAKIPVVLTDRQVDSDQSLWVSLVGSDFELEGERAANILDKVLKATPVSPVNIAVLEGTTGSAPATQRAAGFKKIMDASHPDWKIVVSQTGNFTRDGGKQVMAAFLQSHPEANVLFAHNDDMGLGAIQSIEAAGKKPGTDIKIISVDAVKDGMTALSTGKINHIVECSPLLGPQLMDLAKKVVNGESVEPRILTVESEFTPEQAKAALPDRKY
jgi:ABC-type sugar transport system substrate-binding protein